MDSFSLPPPECGSSVAAPVLACLSLPDLGLTLLLDASFCRAPPYVANLSQNAPPLHMILEGELTIEAVSKSPACEPAAGIHMLDLSLAGLLGSNS